MRFEVVTDLELCRLLWQHYAPHNKIWDEWDVACSFYNPDQYQLHFMHFFDEQTPIGLVPLYFYDNNIYYFFGEGYPENRRFWFDISRFPEIYEFLPAPLKIFDLQASQVHELLQLYPSFASHFEEKDYRYYLDLSALSFSVDNYLDTLSKKHKKNLLYDLKKLQEHTSYELVWEQLEHFTELVEFNTSRFGQESDLHDEDFVKELFAFFSVVKERGWMHTLSVRIEGRIVGVEVAAFYQGKYYVLNGGYDRSFANLGKLIIFEHIKKACELKAQEIDLLVGDTGWKQLWNFIPDECFTFTKN